MPSDTDFETLMLSGKVIGVWRFPGSHRRHPLTSRSCLLLKVSRQTVMPWWLSLRNSSLPLLLWWPFLTLNWSHWFMLPSYIRSWELILLIFQLFAGWLRILKGGYSSGGTLQGRPVLILYSPDHPSFERLVNILAAALAQLQASVSVELWSRGELGALGPMQWFHAQRHQVLQGSGAIVLLFSHGALAGCAEWLDWKRKGLLPPAQSDSTFLASLNCIMPDILAGKARDNYMAACFEELFPAAEIPGPFHSVPVYQLPLQLFSFLLALAGPDVGREQRNGLRRHVAWIAKSLQRGVEECWQKEPS
uniref:Uncharacterized protein n=1 Tax=Sphaerodactylus townsendi TaxID=933632 RepID=A0ACB8EGA3_9SAUR